MSFFTKKEWLFIGLIFLLFLSFRLPAINIPYHQDEYKWVQYSHPEILPPGTVPHPPLTEFIYTRLGPILGDDNFRVIPILFSVVNFFLLFYLAKTLFDKRTAFYVVGLFAISFYSVLASVMVDVDGAVMPFFLLLLSIGYFKFKESLWTDYRWIILIIIGAVGGFLIKMSGVLPLVAFGLDFAIEMKVFSDKKKVFKYMLYGILSAFFLVGVLLLSKLIFPFFRLEYSLTYWKHFANSSSFFDRGWFQTLIQLVKAVLYSSPLLLVPLVFVDKEIFKKTRPFFIFIFVCLSFYLVIFDFSIGALDRYFEFLVIPLSLIVGLIYAKYFEWKSINKKSIIIFSFIALIIFLVQFISHGVPPLYPKTEWISRAISFKWNFLYPFSGGSGPIPFYISFAFMSLAWLSTIAILFLYRFKYVSRSIVFAGILIMGLVYNGVFIEEYLFGKINGNSSGLVHRLTDFIKTNESIKNVTVYNDNGGWNIQAINKYRKRLYIDPKFDVVQKVATLNQYKEHYMVVNIPHIDSDTVYAKYFASCKVIYNEKSGVIDAKVYDCTKAPDLKI
ncbi:MAG: Melittin resistance protein PqaB [Parcubacteria bacterium C7867-003]|nr:MAG: Melittin resistance protein PqaB [Parcubacteria bacterium C7867-003]